MEKEAEFLVSCAAGGAAAVTIVAGVSPRGVFYNCILADEAHTEYLKGLSDAVRARGSHLIVQLFHSGRNAKQENLYDPALPPLAPSPIPSPLYKQLPEEMTAVDIAEAKRQFVDAALVCKEAGVGAIEINCTAGYLLTEFISPLTNLRTDKYGGSLENRLRFPSEVIKDVRAAVGQDYSVMIRVSGTDLLGGYEVEDVIALLEGVRNPDGSHPIDLVCVTGGWHESKIPQISADVEPGSFTYLAREIKDGTGLPAVACNRINDGEIAERVLARGDGDFVGIARGFLADPDFANKLQHGEKINRCIACNQCIKQVLRVQEIHCTVNEF
jgi:2,4-dienoyl-CoA reductase (NADPH2)